MSNVAELMDTINVLKGVYGTGSRAGALSPDVAKDFRSTLGLVPYNLEQGARLLSPVITPLRNAIPRNKGKGTATEFKAITSYNSAGVTGWVGEGVSNATSLTTTVVDVLMKYKIASQVNNVSFEAQFFGAGQIDAKALAVANLLRAFMIDEENRMLFGNPSPAVTAASSGGQSVSIGGAIGTSPALTLGTTGLVPGTFFPATTGGTLAANATYVIYQTALTGPGQESLATAAGSQNSITTTGASSSIVVTPTYDPRAISYNLYFKRTADPGWTVYNTSGKAVTITSYTAVGTQTVANTPPLAANSPPYTSVDTSANALAFPGVLQQLFATGSGATITQLNRMMSMGSATVFGDIDNLMLNIWNSGKGDPDWLVCNAAESLTITGGTLQNGAPYYIQPGGEQSGAVGGFRVSRFTNKVTGSLMDVKVHPTLPQGTMLALSMRMPGWYPGSDIPSVWSMEMSYDYLELDYPPTSPVWPIEVRNAGALLLYLPLINGALTGISLT